MADKYWIGNSVTDLWNDDDAWSSTSGGSPDTVKPANGDNVFFDSASPVGNPPLDGPAAPVALATLDCTGYSVDLSVVFNGNISIQESGIFVSAGATIVGDVEFGSGATATFSEQSTCATDCSFLGNNVIAFTGTATNNCAAIGGNGNTFSLNDDTTNTVALNFIGVFNANTGGTFVSSAGAITCTTVNINGDFRSSTVDCTTANITAGGIFEIGVLTAGTINLAGSNVDHISGSVVATGNSENTGVITGNVTASGNFSNAGTITGNLTSSSSAVRNSGGVSGVFTTPGVRNANGTIGYAGGSLGTFGTLNLTGIPRAVLGGFV